MSNSIDKNLISSKEVLEKTNISRATLNNYIKMGIIPRPVVKGPKNDMKRTKKIGYFSESVVETINMVKHLKRKGHSMEEIAGKYKDMRLVNQPFQNGHKDNTYPELVNASALDGVDGKPKIIEKDLKLTIDNIGYSAYLVNKHFEIEWINHEAEDEIFNQDISSIAYLESRNIFKLFFSWEFHENVSNWKDLINFHMAFAKSKINKSDLETLCNKISDREIRLLEEIYDEDLPLPKIGIDNKPINIVKKDGSVRDYEIYTVTFREGMLFVYVPAERMHHDIMELLLSREKVINNLLQQRMPSLVSLCILVADLQDSVKISAELPPAEYFELINQLWKSLSNSFEKYHGIDGKHAGDGVLYYFIKKPGCNYILDAIHCAMELRTIVKEISNEWKIRKGWLNNLYLNIGINEGKEFFGTIQSTSSIEFTALGDSINYAGRLSDLARFGAILATKNTINKLESEELKHIRFGIRRKENEREIFIEKSFSRVFDLLDQSDQRYNKFLDISTLPLTEIVDIEDQS